VSHDDRVDPISEPPELPDDRRVRKPWEPTGKQSASEVLNERITKLEIASAKYRERFRSITSEVAATAEDTAQREIKGLRELLQNTEKEKYLTALQAERDKLVRDAIDVQKMAGARRDLWTRRMWILVRTIMTTLFGLLLERYGHVLPK
jgi:hypothetical protein